MKNKKAAGSLLIIITLIISLIIMLMLLIGNIIKTDDLFDTDEDNKSAQIVKPDEFKPLKSKGKNLYKFEDGFYKGYYDENLNVKIKPKFKVASEFTDGVAVVSEGDKYGVIDSNGETIFDYKYDSIDNFNDGYAIAKRDDDYYVLDINGNENKINADIDYCEGFNEGRAIFTKDNKKGVIDNEGNVIVKPKYRELSMYTDGIAVGSKFLSGDVPIDRNGNILDKDILKNQYQNGVLIYKDRIFDYYNNELQDINNKYNCIHMIYDKIVVSDKEYTKFGVIDKDGNLLLKVKYDDIYSNSNFGYFFVRYNNEKCIINLKDEKIISLKEDVIDVDFASDDLIRITYSDDSNEIINKDGKVLISKNDGDKYSIYGDFIIKDEELENYNEDEVINDKKIDVYNKEMKLIYSDKVKYYDYDNRYYYEGNLNLKERVLQIKSQNANEYYLNTDGKLVNRVIYEK
ncbi:KWG repeat-containing protein [Clostridium baratii]|uniref:WG repeat-containing protein n=1 Tax=Clostridium baratii TaxID=1561 RepID=UPI0006C52916|nr:WG repeat-containing protein [Clostridium baratii]MDU1054233.1 WG repeat-containing protein [Clostridium baratii]CUP53930.1 KWG repeat-containing protein [Clostridium baratii]